LKHSHKLVVIALSFCFTSIAGASNAVRGAELFKQCIACHSIGEGTTHGVGPTLNHVFGRVIGTADGYTTYSDGMIARGQASKKSVWNEKTLYKFLANPAKRVKGTTMAFPGFKTEKEIKDLLAFLIQYSPAYEAKSNKAVSAEAIAAATLPPPPSTNEVEETPEFTDAYMASADAITGGEDLWAKQCRHCHGNAAYPGKAPKLNTAVYNPDFVFDRITNGFKKMPAWKTVFTLEERMALTAYVMSDSFSP
jgi:cytochrome c2